MKLLFVCLCIALLVCSVSAALPETQAVTESTNTRVVFNRNAGNTAPCWFVWGSGSNYYWTTPNQTVCGSDYQYGAPMLTGETYNVKACDATGCDLTPVSWTVPPAKMLEITNFGSGVTTIMRSGFNVTQVTNIIISPYVDNLAYIASGVVSTSIAAEVRNNAQGIIVGILFFFIYVGYWLRGQGIGLPAFMSVLSYGAMFGAQSVGAQVPQEFQSLGFILLVVGVAGLIYSWFSNK